LTSFLKRLIGRVARRKKVPDVGVLQAEPEPISKVAAEAVKAVEAPPPRPEPKPTSTMVAEEVKAAQVVKLAEAPRPAMRKVRAACPKCGTVQTQVTERRISFCPNCGSYLSPIVQNSDMFATKAATVQRSTVPEFRSDGTQTGELASFLSRHGFHVALHAKQYLAGRHAKSDNTVFVKVMQRGLLDSSDLLAGFHFAVDSFKRLIEGLDRTWSIQTKALVSGLNPEVLTPFGWHAYYDEPTRQGALERSAAGLGVDHVLNVLKWLKNSWPKHPTHYVHSETVKRDYLWFDRTFGEKAYPYRRKRRELRTRIESECQRAVAESPSIRRMLGGRSADRFFIVLI
jgi:hypothetical protein